MQVFTEAQIEAYGKLRTVAEMVAHPIGEAAIASPDVRKTLRSLCKIRNEPIPPVIEEPGSGAQK